MINNDPMSFLPHTSFRAPVNIFSAALVFYALFHIHGSVLLLVLVLVPA